VGRGTCVRTNRFCVCSHSGGDGLARRRLGRERDFQFQRAYAAGRRVGTAVGLVEPGLVISGIVRHDELGGVGFQDQELGQRSIMAPRHRLQGR
jgi:hypothetical protein